MLKWVQCLDATIQPILIEFDEFVQFKNLIY